MVRLSYFCHFVIPLKLPYPSSNNIFMKDFTVENILRTPIGKIKYRLLTPEDVTTLRLAQSKDTKMTKLKWWRDSNTSLGGYVLWNKGKMTHGTHKEILKEYNRCYTSMAEVPTIMETDYFRDEFAFLSNMSPVDIYEDKVLRDPITGYGVSYLENLYQSQKFEDKEIKMRLLKVNPGEAKTLGRTLPGEIQNFGSKKVLIMENLLRQKFDIPTLKDLLLATGKLKLLEVNHWYDYFWGICNGKGDNKLGELLEKIRKDKGIALF